MEVKLTKHKDGRPAGTVRFIVYPHFKLPGKGSFDTVWIALKTGFLDGGFHARPEDAAALRDALTDALRRVGYERERREPNADNTGKTGPGKNHGAV